MSRATLLPVREVTNNQRVQANHVYVIPPNTNLSIAQGVLKLQPRQQTRTPHRSIDFFFESLAEDQREQAIGVILSGTATDGTLGLTAIKAEGGITFAQDDSARYDSMPRSAVAAGCVDFVLSPEDIAKELVRIAKHPYVAGGSLTPAEDERADATAHEDPSTLLRAGDATALPSGGRGTPRTGAKQARAEAEAARGKAGENAFKKILLLLRNHSGVDFSLYRSTTIERRITRRMVLNKHDTLESYAASLRGNAKELNTLYSDVLISVTSFFRNPEAFDVLKRTVFPKLLRQRGEQPFRVWVLGCSTGQEAYSITMAFVEAAENAPDMRKLQVFATDLNDALLDKARHGLYTKSLADDVSPERLRRFFVEEEGGYRVVKSLREMVVFARQNLIADPPFSRMDLVSCRNLLIYLEPSLQKKALPTFHYALKPGGFLFLGASESIGGFTDLFEPVDKKHKVYSKKVAPMTPLHLPLKRARGEHPSPGQGPLAPLPMRQGEAPVGFRAELNAQREADRVTVGRFAPPGVLIDAELQILQFRGPTGAYLEPPPGKPSFDVLKMAREGLMLPLRAAITQAKKENKAARRENARIEQNGKTRTVNLEVIPLKNLRERCFLILFEETEQLGHAGDGAPLPEAIEPRGAVRTPSPTAQEESGRVADLEREISEMRDYLQSIQEQYEAANEELQASSEEAQSTNEELQSINEELETSKEELESANEELTTVNEEMGNRNAELNRIHGDLFNLQTSTKLAVVLLGRDMSIRRFSAQAEKQFDLLATDLGRPVSYLRHHLVFPPTASAGDSPDPTSRAWRARQGRASARNASPIPVGGLPTGAGESPPPGSIPRPYLETFIAEVIDTVREREREVQDQAGRWYSLRVRPYMTLDNKVDGAVLVLIDIDALKRSEHAVAAARDYAEAIVSTAPDPLLILDADLRVHTANAAFYNTFKVEPSGSEGRLIYELGNHQWNIPRLRELLEDILPRNSFFDNFEVTHDFETIGRRTMLLNARGLRDIGDQPARILLGIQDITERKRAEEATARLAAIVTTSKDAIISKDLDGVITSWNKGAEHLFGYSTEEVIGKPVTLLIPEDHVDEEPRILEQIRRGEMIEHYETVRRRKDGSLLDISLTVSPLKNAAGRITGASKIGRDITERKRAEEALRRHAAQFETLLYEAPLGVYLVDGDFRIRHVNPTTFQVFGDIPDLIGRDFDEVIHLLWPKAFADEVVRLFRHTLETGEPYTCPELIEQRLDRGVTEYYQWQINRIPLPKGRYGVVCYFRDISAQVQARAAIVESDRRKSEFLAMLAHELRNPLAPIRNAVQVMRLNQSGEGRVTSGEKEESGGHLLATRHSPLTTSFEMIERQVGQMVRLVDDLLDVSRISRGEIELRKERVELASVVHHAVEACRPAMERAKHELSITLPPQPLYLNADPTRLAQVVGNLLNNACKFTDKGGRIEVVVSVEWRVVSEEKTGEFRDDRATLSGAQGVANGNEKSGEWRVTSDEKEDSGGDLLATHHSPLTTRLLATRHSPLTTPPATPFAVIRVRDTGIGIAADMLPRIFDMFMQVDTSLERTHSGLGIGLTLVRELVELHGGTLEAHSAGIGQGSEFVVRLPLPSDEWRVARGSLASSFSPLSAASSLSMTTWTRQSLWPCCSSSPETRRTPPTTASRRWKRQRSSGLTSFCSTSACRS